MWLEYSKTNILVFRSWLLFHLLKLEKRQEWLSVPCNLWIHFEDFRIANEFVNTLISVNDCEERGIKLISDFQDCCYDPQERELLLQLVEERRSSVSIHDFNKESMLFL